MDHQVGSRPAVHLSPSSFFSFLFVSSSPQPRDTVLDSIDPEPSKGQEDEDEDNDEGNGYVPLHCGRLVVSSQLGEEAEC